MTKTSRFRFLGIVSVLAIMAVICWQILPETSAQRNSKQLAGDSAGGLNSVKAGDSLDAIMLNARQINVKAAETQAERTDASGFSGKRLHLVRFNGPIQGKWVDALESTGAQIVDYIPHYTYLIYGDSPTIQRIQSESRNALSPIEWEGPYRDDYRIMPDVYFDPKLDEGLTGLRTPEFSVQLVSDEAANAETFSLLEKIRTSPIKGKQSILRYTNFEIGLDAKGLEALAARPDVISIYPYIEPRKFDERQTLILRGNLTGNNPTPGDWLQYLAGKGFTQAQFDASNFIVDVTDSGIDTATPASPNQWLLRQSGSPTGSSRFAYSRLEGTPHVDGTIQGCDGHGNLNATIVAGYVPGGAPFNTAPHADASGFRYGMGVAPFVKVGSSVIFDPNVFTNPNIPNLQSKAYQDGARISTNSWGSASAGAYNATAQAYDALVRDAQPTGSTNPTAGNQEMVIVFSAGNDGSVPNSMGAPGTAKNVFTVGASENVQAFGGADGCGTGDDEANSAHDIVDFSSRGPNDDGRVKPDIMLPGTHVSGGVAQNVLSNPVTGIGSKLPCFAANGVCGGPGPNFDFFPLGQEWYTASSGTSHSTPAIAGVTALVRQHFINQGLTPPSPAMTKAIIMNSAEYMNGVGANDTLPSNNQGMGLADMDRYFDIFAQGKVLRDQNAADTFGDTGQQRVFAGNVDDNTKPFRVTLAWTDPPGSTTGNAFINNLDLEVTVGGIAYKGNAFTGANSSGGGTADIRNNVESVFVPAGVNGTFVVKVKSTNIAGDGLPGNADITDQDFALVISNGEEGPVAVLESTGVTLTAENGVPANNTPDPGETVTVQLGLQNVGTTNSGTVVTTLLNSGGITNPSGPQNYGVLVPGAGATNRSFTFDVPAAAECGSSITLTFSVQEGANPPFQITKVYGLGVPGIQIQNFDGVTAPALPAGWTTSQTGGPPAWTTSTTGPPDSAPNSAFVADVVTTGESSLVSPVVTAGTGSQVKFRHKYNTENNFDGGVLEIKIGAGEFADIVTAGGSFVEGGYDDALTPFAGCLTPPSTPNPLGARLTWNGSVTAYKTTTANLPPSAAGQSVQFRWRLGTDCSVVPSTGVPGWNIDNIELPGQSSCAIVPGGEDTRVRADFDGDGRTDLSIYRPSDGRWWVNQSTNGLVSAQWGIAGDIPFGGDFSGEGGTDLTVYRPQAPIDLPDFFIYKTDPAVFEPVSWGLPGDKPLIGDYNGDGVDDIGVFRPSESVFYILFHNDALPYRAFQFGQTGDIPLVGDFSGDGTADAAFFRPSNGTWYIAETTGDPSSEFTAIQLGSAGDKPVPADYDGDGKDDIAVYRPSQGLWYILLSQSQQLSITQWGLPTDIPVPGDYDGDGKYDIAIYRAGQWWVIGSTAGPSLSQWGLAGDVPIPATYIP